MKIGNIQIHKKYFYTIILLVLVVSSIVGYSYINSDLIYTGNVTMKKAQCNQANFYDRMACMSVNDFISSAFVTNADGINYLYSSSATNGRGVYTLSSSLDDTFPVYYYRGAVEDNNVKFAGYCWKAVRTTEKGGIKLVYNGTPKMEYETIEHFNQSDYINIVNDATYPFSFDEENKEWRSTNNAYNTTGTIKFTIQEAGDYILSYRISSYQYHYGYIYIDGISFKTLNGGREGTIELKNVDPSMVIEVRYYRGTSNVVGEDAVIFSIGRGIGEGVEICDNSYDDSGIGEYQYNSCGKSPALGGYMYGQLYYHNNVSTSGSFLYGNGFTYENGVYTLTDTSESFDSTHHYSCLNDSGQCNELYYLFTQGKYMTLTGGKSIEDILDEMLSGSTNTTNSTVKTAVDNWFENNFIPYFTALGKNYDDYLEDAIWCNDRSINPSRNTGFNPNGGNPNTYLFYGKELNSYIDLTCPNKNDAFTVSDTQNGNAKLTYPVALLTHAETYIAGNTEYGSTDYYLNTHQNWWTMSPYFYYDYGGPYVYSAISNGSGWYTNICYSYSVRPSIVLKHNIEIISGNGEKEQPFIIE